jgi:Flp pilus assembly protein TadD
MLLTAASGCAAVKQRLPFAKKTDAETAAKGQYESSLSLARLSERHGQIENARQVYDAVLRKDPENAFAHHRLGVMAARERQLAKADEHLSKALTAGTPSADLLADVGYLYYLQDRLPEAEEKLRQSLELAPTNRTARTNLGLVLGEQGRLDESYAEFCRADTEAQARANLGYVYAMLGDLERAEAEYHVALSLDPSLRQAAEALGQLAQRRRAFRGRGASENVVAQVDSNAPNRLPSVQDPFFVSVTEVPQRRQPDASRMRAYLSRPMAPPNAIPTAETPRTNPSMEIAALNPSSPPVHAPPANAVQQASYTAVAVPTVSSPWSTPTWTPTTGAPSQHQP